MNDYPVLILLLKVSKGKVLATNNCLHFSLNYRNKIGVKCQTLLLMSARFQEISVIKKIAIYAAVQR